jgi:excinuclease UvrABC ATPase subunit
MSDLFGLQLLLPQFLGGQGHSHSANVAMLNSISSRFPEADPQVVRDVFRTAKGDEEKTIESLREMGMRERTRDYNEAEDEARRLHQRERDDLQMAVRRNREFEQAARRHAHDSQWSILESSGSARLRQMDARRRALGSPNSL